MFRKSVGSNFVFSSILPVRNARPVFRRSNQANSAKRKIRSLPKSANMISMQGFTGRLGGRDGTFVLQGKETAENGKTKATCFVISRIGHSKFSGFEAKEVLAATLEKGLTDGWIIGSAFEARPIAAVGQSTQS
jgi:hypothetical protein